MKTKYIYLLLFIVSTLFVTLPVQAQNKEMISYIKEEVERNKQELKIVNLQRPFFIGYSVADIYVLDIIAAYGSLEHSVSHHFRRGYPQLLVGDYARNNRNFMDMSILWGHNYRPPLNLPVEDDATGIRNVIWRDLDGQYKDAAEKLETKLAVLRQQNLSEEEAGLSDFEKRDPVQLFQKTTHTAPDKTYWEEYAKQASAVFSEYPEILTSFIHVTIQDALMYYYNTEGTEFIQQTPYYIVHFHVSTLTDDGQDIGDDFYFEHTTIKDMPDLKSIQKECHAMAQHVVALKNAPLIDETYSGPVLMEKMALAETVQGIFFSNGSLMSRRKPIADQQVLQHYGGHPQLQGNSMDMMYNKRVIARTLSLTSMTGTEFYQGKRLDAYSPLDAQGVSPDKELTLIENGILKNMLNDRTPSKIYGGSNGHARMNLNNLYPQVTPGNVRLSSTETCSNEVLKKKLINAIKDENMEYGYIVRRSRGNNALAIYRIYVDNGREELVRGAILENLNMDSFKRVLGTSNEEWTHNTMSFGTFATYIVPEGLLFEELRITRNNGLNLRPPYVVPQPLQK